MYYTTDRVVNIIKNYHTNYAYVYELANQVNQSVGVGQYGIEYAKGNRDK